MERDKRLNIDEKYPFAKYYSPEHKEISQRLPNISKMKVKNVTLDASEDPKRALVHEHRNSCKNILKTITNMNTNSRNLGPPRAVSTLNHKKLSQLLPNLTEENYSTQMNSNILQNLTSLPPTTTNKSLL